MNEEERLAAEAAAEKGKEAEEIRQDSFGVNLDEQGNQINVEEPPEPEKEDGISDDDVKDIIKEDIESNDVVVDLRNKVADYSKNLKGQNDVIGRLRSQIDELSKNTGGAKEPEEMFNNIKTSQDLTTEQREEMTETEIALMDQNATTQKAINEILRTLSAKNKAGEDEKVENLNYSSRSEATRLAEEAIKTNPSLAGNASELTDKILLEFKEFNNEQITPDVLISRMSKALNNVQGYTAPKEQESVPTGGTHPVKSGGSDEKDPFGNELLIEQATKSNDGNYQL